MKSPEQKAAQVENVVPPVMLLLLKGGKDAETALDDKEWAKWWSRLPRFAGNAVDQPDSSINHKAMSATVGLYHRETRGLALDAWLGYQALCEIVGYEAWEVGSRIYGHMTLCAALQTYRWCVTQRGPGRTPQVQAVQGFLTDYLRYWWLRERVCMVETQAGPRSLRCGARSQGTQGVTAKGVWAGILSDYALGLSGLSKSHWRWLQGGGNAYWRNTTWGQIISELEPEIAATAQLLGDGREVRLYPSLTEMHALRTSEGLAVWCEAPEQGADGVPNNNTVGMAALGVLDSQPETLWSFPPIGQDPHVRQGHFVESCWRDGSVLHYRGEGTGESIVAIRDLPGGTVISHLVFSKEGIKEAP